MGVMHTSQGNIRGKGAETGAFLACSRNGKEASLAEWHMTGYEVREGSRGQIIVFLVDCGKEFGFEK